MRITKQTNSQRSTAFGDDQVVRLVDDVISRALVRRASDVHFEPAEAGLRVRFRVDGLLLDVDQIPAHLAENVVARLKVMANLLTYRLDVPQEGVFRTEPSEAVTESIDVRVATFPTVRGERVAVRLLYQVGQVCGLEELGLSERVVGELRAAGLRTQGLILVTGPAGSGKSTTLYALARHILLSQPERSVVSLEDPVERRLPGMTQIQISSYGELNYAKAMRSLLRQDVEVLLIGEIRDAETAHLVVEAALTGHLVMSTLHSGDPAETIVRLVEMGIAPYQVVSGLTVCCSQRLLRRVCSACGGKPGVAEGCEVCLKTGFNGRIACGQIVSMNDAMRQAVLDHRPLGELREIISAMGPDLPADANRLVNAGVTTAGEVRRVLGA